jgi:PHD/YefM family antitoxin component YafN of YafNO toxin-antitoxin module
MITVKMTNSEYKAYLLYLKSIEIMQEAKDKRRKSALDEYLSDPENIKEIEAGLEDIKAGRITFIDPDNLWEDIR